MIVADLVSFICTKVNQNEAEDQAACKLFFARRYEMLWNDQLWKDALIDYTVTLPTTPYVPTSVWLPTKQILLLPPTIERPIAVRTSTRHLNVVNAEQYYRVDFDAFSSTGSLVEYTPLSSVIWEFDSPAVIKLVTDGADVNKTATADVLESDGVTVKRTTAGFPQIPNPNQTLIDTGSRLDTLAKLATTQAVNLAAGPLLTNNCAEQHVFTFLDSSSTLLLTLTLASKQSGFFPPTTATIKVDGINPLGTAADAAQGAQITASNIGAPGSAVVYATGFNYGPTILTLAAADLVAPVRCRLRLMGLPDASTTLRVLGKLKCPALSADGDVTRLTGVDNPLIAFVQGDMLARERQYSKAQACYQEGRMLLEQLKAEEVVQTARNNRIIPEDGYGDPNDLWSHSPLTF